MRRKKYWCAWGLMVCLLLTGMDPYMGMAKEKQPEKMRLQEVEEEKTDSQESGIEEESVDLQESDTEEGKTDPQESGVKKEKDTLESVTTSTEGELLLEENSLQEKEMLELENTEREEPVVILVEDFQSFAEAVAVGRERSSMEELAERRLIVQSSHGFDPGNAMEIIQGYEDLFVLTYPSVEACNSAYESLQNIPELSVEKDTILMTSTEESSAAVSPEETNGCTYVKLPVTSREIKIAVIDSGYDFAAHPNDRVETGLDLTGTGSTQDLHGHGTAMTGILLEHTSDCVKILPVKAADSNGRTSALKIYLGIQYAVEQNADLINLSMTAYKAQQSDMLARLITEVSKQGTLVVTAAGNENQDTAEYMPANVDAAVVVAAMNPDGSKMESSNYGATVDFTSYGSVESYGLGGGKSIVSGTSVSAALISVAAAQLLIMDNDADRNTILQKLEQGAYDLGEPGKDPYFGYGAVTPEQVNALYEGTVCETAAIFTADVHQMGDTELDQLLEATTQVNVSRFLKDLTEEERAYLLSRNTMLSRGYEVWENITNQQETCTYREYESYYDYLMENEFETAWYASTSTKSGYWYFSLNGDVDRYNVELTGLPTAGNEDNVQAKITRSWDADYVDSNKKKGHTNGISFSSGHAPAVATGLGDESYIYIGMQLEIPTQKGKHCQVSCSGVSGLKTSDGTEVQGGAGITVWEDEKKGIIKKCTKNKTSVSGIGCQIGFGAAGIDTVGTIGGTGHCTISLETKANEKDSILEKNNNIENGKRTKKCKECKTVIAEEYLQITELRFMDEEGNYPVLETYARMQEKYVKEGETVPAYIYNESEQGNFRKAERESYTAAAKAKRTLVSVPRKTYSILFFGNGNTAGATAGMSPVYFGQTKALTANGFIRENMLELEPNGGTFKDGVTTVKKQVIRHTFRNWNRDPSGAFETYGNMQSIRNLTTIDRDTINFYAIWNQGSTQLPEVEKTGYRFKGWAAEQSEKKGITGSYSTWENESLYAIWEEDVFTIKLDAQGADIQGTAELWEKYGIGYYSEEKCDKTFKENKIDLPHKTDKTGEIEWVFAGYFTEKNGAGKQVILQDGTLVSNIGNAGDYQYFTEDATVYAYYQKCFPMIYHSNLSDEDRVKDSEVTLPAKQIIGAGESITLTCEKPVVNSEDWKYIYRFRGWSTTADGTNILVDPYERQSAKLTMTKRLDLYAVWDTDFKVSYIGNEQKEGKDYVDGVHKLFEEYTIKSNNPEELNLSAGEDYFRKVEELPAMDIATGEYVDEEGNPYTEKVEYAFQGWSYEKTEGHYQEDHIFQGQSKNPGDAFVGKSFGFKENTRLEENQYIGITIGKPSAYFGEYSKAHADEDEVDGAGEVEPEYAQVHGDSRNLTEHEEDMPYVNLFAVWDEYPRIYASDNYFALEYAPSLTTEQVLGMATATDRENPEEVVLEIKAFDQVALQEQAEQGNSFAYPITYIATDAKGNQTEKVVTFYFTDSEAYNTQEGKVRFISADYMATLDSDSIWKSTEYEAELASCLLNQREEKSYTNPTGLSKLLGEKAMVIAGTGHWQKEPEQVWSFTKEQIAEMKHAITGKSVGTKETIQNFMIGYESICREK